MSSTRSSTGDSKVIGTKVLRPRQQVEEGIRSAILSGELKDGDLLPPEAELARQFAVSRTTLREALRSLSTQHLITKVPGAKGGNFVRSMDHHSLGSVVIDSMHNLLAAGSIDFAEVSLVRQYLEVPSVRLAARHRTEDQLRQLHEIVAQQARVTVDDLDVPRLDEEFHSLIAKASGNRVLSALVRALHHETEPVHYLTLTPEVGRQTVRQHVAILDAIEAGDPVRGEEAIVIHLEYLRQHSERQGGDSDT